MPRKTKQNDITSPELLEQVCQENKDLVRDFLDYLKAIDRSEGTRSQYKNDLDIFFVWNLKNNNNKPFYSVTKRNIVSYQNWLINENGNSAARVRRLKAALSSMSNFIETVIADDEPEYKNFRNIINKIENPVLQPVREKTVLTENDVQTILDNLVLSEKYEKACLVALAAYGGRRKSELPRFKVSDFDDSKLVCNGALYKSDPIKTKGRGSGGKVISCYTLAKKFKPYLDMWMAFRAERGIENEYLLVDPQDYSKQLSVSTINSWVNEFSKIAGVPIYMHSFRHRFVTALSEAGIPEGVITEIVGWGDVSMCKCYDDTPPDNKISMYFNADGDITLSNKKNIEDI